MSTGLNILGCHYPGRMRSSLFSEAARAMRFVKNSKHLKLLSADGQTRVQTWSNDLIEKVFYIL